jgi:hypothetical protein
METSPGKRIFPTFRQAGRQVYKVAKSYGFSFGQKKKKQNQNQKILLSA